MAQVPDTNASVMTQERLLPGQAPVLLPGHTMETITDKIVSIVLRRPVTLGWLGGFTDRGGEGEPGVNALWRGLSRVQEGLIGAEPSGSLGASGKV